MWVTGCGAHRADDAPAGRVDDGPPDRENGVPDQQIRYPVPSAVYGQAPTAVVAVLFAAPSESVAENTVPVVLIAETQNVPTVAPVL